MATTILSLAKTTRPTLAMVVTRERLFRNLDEALTGARAAWIGGPPGAGKTTLAASYLEARSRPALWYQLDSADSDVATFLYYLRQTALKHSAGATTPIPELAAGDEADWQSSARRLFRALFARFDRRLVIVFDNHEEIPQHSGLHEILATAIEETPPGRAICFLSRGEPPAAMARAQVNQFLRPLAAEALRLTLDECVQVASLRGAGLAAELLSRIQSASAGWMAGAILLIEHARTTPVPALTETTGGVLYDYVAREIFAQFDRDVQHLLLALCWARRLSLSLAEALSGDRRIRQVLVNLARNNYFVTERDETGEREYMLHPLLRQFLQAKATEALDRRSLAAQQLRCAELLLEVGYIEEAVELLALNLEWDRLETTILEFAPTLVDQTRLALLSSWIEELPHERVERNGWLTYWQGIAAQGQARRASRQSLERALRLFVAGADTAGIMRAADSLIELIISDGDDYSLVEDALDALRSMFDAGPDILDGVAGLRSLTMLILATVLRDPARSELPHWWQIHDRLTRKVEAQATITELQLLAALATLLSGDLERAGMLLSRIQAQRADDGAVALGGRLALVTNLHRLFTLPPDEALVHWRAALERVVEDAEPRVVRLAHIGVAAAGLMADRATDVAASLAAIEGFLGEGDKLCRCLGHYVLSWAAHCTDDTIAAYHRQRQAVAHAVELGMPYLEVLCRTGLAQLLFLCRDPRGGASQLRRVHAIARDIHNPMLEYLTLLVYGDVAVREKRLNSGINALRYAFGLGRQHGYFNLPWWRAPRLADLCVVALDHDIEVEFVRSLVKRHTLRPQRSPAHLEHWPWTLQVRTFGGLVLSSAVERHATIEIGQGRPNQLFKLIAAGGEGGIRTESAASAIWPRVDSEYALKSLTINLHRLRRLLGHDEFVLLRDGCLSLNAELVFSDVRAFECLTREITASRAGDERTALAQLERLLALYRGPWLAGDSEVAAFDAARARLQSAFVDAITTLAETLRWRDNPVRARGVYERALQRDAVAEPLYHGLMMTEAMAGDAAMALAVYERCRRALQAVDRSPGAEIEALRAAVSERTTG